MRSAALAAKVEKKSERKAGEGDYAKGVANTSGQKVEKEVVEETDNFFSKYDGRKATGKKKNETRGGRAEKVTKLKVDYKIDNSSSGMEVRGSSFDTGGDFEDRGGGRGRGEGRGRGGRGRGEGRGGRGRGEGRGRGGRGRG